MAKVFYWILPFYLLSFVMSTAGQEIFGWSIFLLFLIDLTCDIKSNGFSKTFKNLRIGADIPVLFFGFWVLLSTYVLYKSAEEVSVSFRAIRWIFLLYGFSYLLKKYFTLSYKKHLYFLLAATILVGIYGVIQMFTQIDIIRSSNSHISKLGSFYRATGFFSVPLTYAYCMGMIGAIGFALTLKKTASLNKHYLLPLITALSSTGAVIASSTRGAWISLFITVLLMAFLTNIKKALSILIGSVLVIYILTLSPTFKDRIKSIPNTSNYHSNTERIDIWRANINIFKDHAIWGVGIERSRNFLPLYYEKLNVQNGIIGHAHNDFLNTLSETGVPGALAWLWFCIYFLILNLKLYRDTRSSSLGPLLLGTFGAQVYMHIGGLTQVNFYDNEITHILIFIWALALAIQHNLLLKRIL